MRRRICGWGCSTRSWRTDNLLICAKLLIITRSTTPCPPTTCWGSSAWPKYAPRGSRPGWRTRVVAGRRGWKFAIRNLQEELETRADDRRIVAELLGVPVEKADSHLPHIASLARRHVCPVE